MTEHTPTGDAYQQPARQHTPQPTNQRSTVSEEDIAAKIRWARDRAWVQAEMETSAAAEGDYYDGYHLALMKVYARMFLTTEEQRGVEQARREMFG